MSGIAEFFMCAGLFFIGWCILCLASEINDALEFWRSLYDDHN